MTYIKGPLRPTRFDQAYDLIVPWIGRHPTLSLFLLALVVAALISCGVAAEMELRYSQ